MWILLLTLIIGGAFFAFIFYGLGVMHMDSSGAWMGFLLAIAGLCAFVCGLSIVVAVILGLQSLASS